MPWDGIERRRGSTDHDSLIQMVEAVSDLIRNHKKTVEAFEKHVDKNEAQFTIINRNMYVGIGIIAALQFILKH